MLGSKLSEKVAENLQTASFLVYICRKNRKTMRIDLQLIAAFVLSMGGLILLFCGVFIDPQGEIHTSLLVAFGETCTFAGALFGIDYVYKNRS